MTSQADLPIDTRSGLSPINDVVTSPAMKSGCSSTLSKNGMLVLTPRMRISSNARRMRRTAPCHESARAVYFTNRESKYLRRPVARPHEHRFD